jgi:LytS/YehU family sensor histidine kinase
LLVAAVCVAVQYLLLPLTQGMFPPSAPRYFLQNVYSEAIVYALIVGVSTAGSFAAQARAREQQAAQLALQTAQLETHLAEGRLRVLQAQLNPHFLFNTFNTISAFTDIHPQTARTMMAELGLLLRASLDHAGRQEVPLAAELAFLEHYLAIERLRFEDRLTVRVHADPDAMQVLVPSFVLQPLVENAIRHGTGALLRTGHIEVTVRRDGPRLTLRVEDDGVGLPDGWCLEDHGGVGLSNMARRLEELYGASHTFSIANQPGGGVLVEVAVPLP